MLPLEARLALAILAIYRLARMFAWESGPYQRFIRWRLLIAQRDNPALPPARRFGWVEFVKCPYCQGVWLGLFHAALLGIVYLVPALGLLADLWLLGWGLAGGQAVLLDLQPGVPVESQEDRDA